VWMKNTCSTTEDVFGIWHISGMTHIITCMILCQYGFGYMLEVHTKYWSHWSELFQHCSNWSSDIWILCHSRKSWRMLRKPMATSRQYWFKGCGSNLREIGEGQHNRISKDNLIRLWEQNLLHSNSWTLEPLKPCFRLQILKYVLNGRGILCMYDSIK
jgi:hypothetical protein